MASTQNAPTALKDVPDFSTGFDAAFAKVQGWGLQFYALLPNLVVGLILILIFGFLAFGVSRTIRGYFKRKDRVDLGAILSDFGFWGIMVAGLLIALTVIMPSLHPADLLASLGIGSIAIGFAFKDILQNWFSGLLILLRMPFRRGDQIVVNDAEGTVMRIEPRATVLRTYDGRDIVIPNTEIYTSKVTVNTSQPERRVEMDLTVGYDYEVRKITEIIRGALNQVDEILKDPAPQIMCWELGSTSLGIKLRWWINSGQSDAVISRARAVQGIKEAFEANDVDPTDPQLIYYHNITQDNKQDGLSSTVNQRELSDTLVKTGPPPEFTAPRNDPESDKPKIDSLDKTLLADETPEK